MPGEDHPWRWFERRLGMSASGLLTLLVVVSVLVVISLPRLRSFARSENERDALAAAALIARELPPPGGSADGSSPVGPSIGEVVQGLLRQLPDTELLAEGRTLRRHGYVFTLRRLPAPPLAPGEVLASEAARAPVLAVHAWPWKFGPTGSQSYLALADGRLYRNPEPPAPGTAPSPADWDWASWDPERRP